MVDLFNVTGPVVFSWSEAWLFWRPLLIFIVGMVIYGIFIFKFYRFVAMRDVFHLNLAQYNNAEYPAIRRFLAGIFYIIEYVLLFPLFTFFWFLIMSGLLMFLAKNGDIQNILLVSVALVAAVRATAYYSEDLSKDLAKMLPFALLGVFLVDISFFSFSSSLELVKQMPSFWKTMLYYLGFVIALELVLRIGHGIVSLFYDFEEEDIEYEKLPKKKNK
ncbi:MAG: hypothetical protein ABIG93_04485 [archaeon]|nr:hypothetical protein [Nanoarchaeota archaeon]